MRIAGIGCRRQASLASLLEVLSRIQAVQGTLDALATSVSRSDTRIVRDLSQALGLPLLGISSEELAQQITHTQSARQYALYGTGSLAEAAALAAAGPGAGLLVTRIVSADGMATAALALACSSNPSAQINTPHPAYVRQ